MKKASILIALFAFLSGLVACSESIYDPTHNRECKQVQKIKHNNNRGQFGTNN